MIRVPPNKLNETSAPCPFSAWGMDVIGPIEPAASNGHKFILVAIDYFTKWVEAASYKVVTKKVVADFVKDRIVCRFGVPESIITDAATNLNSDLIRSMCKTFKIKHKNSTLPFALLGYRTTVLTSTRATPYLLVYGTKAVILAEVEIPSLRIIQEPELSDAEWIRSRYEQLALIDRKRMNIVCHSQLYQNRMSRAFNKRVRPRQFTPGQLVLKRIFPHQDEAKGKCSPNWQRLYMVHTVLTGGSLILIEMDGEIWPKPINSGTVKRYYV
ncbi:uncharacterized protein [Nicotiana tomentosiformis]|uniref:uncharacterized protein n=1 Tax=Nicotiana tomentosiformis TaxID=4098 RepID=UPI00388C77F1